MAGFDFDQMMRNIATVATARRSLIRPVLGALGAALVDSDPRKTDGGRAPGRAACPPARRCRGRCCPRGKSCVDGTCCPAGRRCGGRCCAAGDVCADPAGARCVTGSGDCPAGADSCNDDAVVACGDATICRCLRSTEGKTRCGAVAHEFFGFCGVCEDSESCVEQFPDFPELFCVRGTADDDDVCCGGELGFCALPCSFFSPS